MFNDLSYYAMAWSQMVFGPIILLSVMLPVIIYVVARWRAKDDSAPDPHLGMKVAISMFKLSSFHLVLAAAFIMLLTLLVDMPEFVSEQMMRLGAGLALPGTIIFVIHEYALKQTNSEQRPSVARMFAGVSLVQSGMLAFTGLVLGGVVLFQKNPPEELGRASLALLLIYGTAWAMQGISLLRQVTGAHMPTATLTEPAEQSRVA